MEEQPFTSFTIGEPFPGPFLIGKGPSWNCGRSVLPSWSIIQSWQSLKWWHLQI